MTDHEAALRECAELFQQLMDGLTRETHDTTGMLALAIRGGDRCVDALWRQKAPSKDPLKDLLSLARDIKRSADDTPSTVLAQQRTMAMKSVKLAEMVIALEKLP